MLFVVLVKMLGCYRALDWIIPQHMKSRIDTFKEAANEVILNTKMANSVLNINVFRVMKSMYARQNIIVRVRN